MLMSGRLGSKYPQTLLCLEGYALVCASRRARRVRTRCSITLTCGREPTHPRGMDSSDLSASPRSAPGV
jgi:hypothetical protein